MSLIDARHGHPADEIDYLGAGPDIHGGAGIVACSPDRDVLKTLCDLARDWNPERYPQA